MAASFLRVAERLHCTNSRQHTEASVCASRSRTCSASFPVKQVLCKKTFFPGTFVVRIHHGSVNTNIKDLKLLAALSSSDDRLSHNPNTLNEVAVKCPKWIDAFYRFTRPHTVIGTAVAIISISLLAVESAMDFNTKFIFGLVQALVPALFMNFYIVGLNQIYDIEIDKVNKPNLPLASGDFSKSTGVVIVTSFAVLSLALGILIGSIPLLWALIVSFILGTAYSVELPFLRWKRSAFAAATCILAVRAIIVQLAFYFHMQTFVYGRAVIITKPLIFATLFMCFFSVVIALFKDIPDLEGDKVFGIRSFTVRLGQERVFWLCINLLLGAYGVAALVGATSGLLWARISMVLGHVSMAAVLFHRANQIDLKSKVAITSFYMFVWKLFYAEYMLIPLMR